MSELKVQPNDKANRRRQVRLIKAEKNVERARAAGELHKHGAIVDVDLVSFFRVQILMHVS